MSDPQDDYQENRRRAFWRGVRNGLGLWGYQPKPESDRRRELQEELYDIGKRIGALEQMLWTATGEKPVEQTSPEDGSHQSP